MAKAVKKAAKKAVKKAAKKSVRRATVKRAIPRKPVGYSALPGSRILVRTEDVVEPSKLYKGLTKAKDEINDLIQEIIDTSTSDYEIHEIEFAASFSADGKFMGIGVGGAATITFRIKPCN